MNYNKFVIILLNLVGSSCVLSGQTVFIENELQEPLLLVARTYCTDLSGRVRDTVYSIAEPSGSQEINLTDWWGPESQNSSCFANSYYAPVTAGFSIRKPLCPTLLENPEAQACIDIPPTPFFRTIDRGHYRVRLNHTGKGLEVVYLEEPGYVFSWLGKTAKEVSPELLSSLHKGQS